MSGLFSLSGKIALVTGGARGLGRMIAEGLTGAGARVYITSRDADACEATARELGPSCRSLPGEAGSVEGIVSLATRFRDQDENALHILVNNAGRTWGSPIDRFPDKAWPGVLAVNVQAPFRLIQEMLPELEAAGTADDPARIINIGSVAGARANDLGAYSYGASKAALHHLSRQLARDLLGRHINVNAVLPGFFPTAMTAHLRDGPKANAQARVPVGRLGRPDDIAGAVIFLSSRAGAYVTGIELPVDGGILGCGGRQDT